MVAANNPEGVASPSILFSLGEQFPINTCTGNRIQALGFKAAGTGLAPAAENAWVDSSLPVSLHNKTVERLYPISCSY